ncbi:sensor histidine kinase [Myroides pelagicus]|uniref:histidine kinase n=1 Tax=Myroides pelagicus TaxID=270914 RepID=A0A7K1GJG8_9FLAO|nr:HAMP domain-containing sensor histidine kinase [Myroides pelagicus]MEC4113684.1 HAMP domain-containing sensor histidine kinase [Myroides pelagicus]MTH28880.1 HAMP domain-containing protein [Myroides pelagicus]
MKIRTRLTLLFTVLVASLFIVFASILYWSSAQHRENEFYGQLEREAITKAKLFFEAKVKPQTLHRIYKNNSQHINEVEVAIYNRAFELLYHDDVEIDRVKETEEMLASIIANKILHFEQEEWQVVGLRLTFDDKDYIITAAAYDEYGFTKLQNLLYTIAVLALLSIIVIGTAGVFFANRALSPIKKMINEVNEITATSLNLRLSHEQNKDELALLANTFNEMLNRLEYSFDAQKQFVSNISHELRTPLAAIIAELELSLAKEQTREQYVMTIENALADARRLVRLSNSLLDFAKASYDPTEIAFKPVCLDEVVLDACQKLQRINKSYKFSFFIEDSVSREEMMVVSANLYLIQVAFVNLLENACKYSENEQCNVSILYKDNHLIVKVSDTGIGIKPEDMEAIFVPFYRGENEYFKQGNGIGLPLTKKIIDLHKARIAVESLVGKGTTFTIHFPPG